MLRDPAKRSEYDEVHFKDRKRPIHEYAPKIDIEEIEIGGTTAASDAEIHERMLLSLYKQRREHASDPGMIGWLMQEMLECTEEHFEFHVWYLKSKGLLAITEEGKLAITVEGVDHVIASGRSAAEETKLIAKPDGVANGTGYIIPSIQVGKPPPPIICARMKGGTSLGAMPENVSVRARAIVTAGLAKLVEAVNQ